MNTPLLQQLKKHLASIDQDQFRNEWNEIKALGLEGPSMEEFIHALSQQVTISDINSFSTVESSIDLEKVEISAGENNYSLAA
jgi:hypothetical protein